MPGAQAGVVKEANVTIIDRRVKPDPQKAQPRYDPFADEEPIEPACEDEEACEACQ